MVKFLIERAKVVSLPLPHQDLEKGLRKMLRMKDKVEVVRLLVKELDPDLSLGANKMGETPLYIAANRRRRVAEILDHYKPILMVEVEQRCMRQSCLMDMQRIVLAD
ncbi:hypothetical protein V6N13_067758 [Hibiscus sabdariffa]